MILDGFWGNLWYTCILNFVYGQAFTALTTSLGFYFLCCDRNPIIYLIAFFVLQKMCTLITDMDDYVSDQDIVPLHTAKKRKKNVLTQIWMMLYVIKNQHLYLLLQVNIWQSLWLQARMPSFLLPVCSLMHSALWYGLYFETIELDVNEGCVQTLPDVMLLMILHRATFGSSSWTMQKDSHTHTAHTQLVKHGEPAVSDLPHPSSSSPSPATSRRVPVRLLGRKPDDSRHVKKVVNIWEEVRKVVLSISELSANNQTW